MARPQKYDWDKIKGAYESGIDKKEICFTYRMPIDPLTRKINKEAWEIKTDINTDIDALKRGFDGLEQKAEKHPELIPIINEKITTVMEDQELIINNRRILKAFQQQLVKGLKNGSYEKPSDIKLGTATIKDIETVANPKPDVSIQNNNIQITKTLDDFYEA